jgi:hypothetical protein
MGIDWQIFAAALGGGAIVALCGCDAIPKRVAQNDRICLTPPPLPSTSSTTLGEQAAIVDSCIHRWAYRLARSSENAPLVATATLAHCQGAIDYEARYEGNPQKREILQSQAATQQTRPRLYYNALARIIEARAGDCDVP